MQAKPIRAVCAGHGLQPEDVVTLARYVALTVGCFAIASSALACSSSSRSPDTGLDARTGTLDGSSEAKTTCSPFDAAGEPYLIDLRVTANSDGEPPIALVPSYCPSIHDYYVTCATGTNKLTVSMTAAAGSMSLLVQPTVSPALVAQTLPVDVSENQAIVAAASDSTSKVEYWVRCLPPDFPEMNVTLYSDAGTASPGYYLVGSLLTRPGLGGYAMIVDQNGVPVWYARQPDDRPVIDVDSVVSDSVSFSFVALATASVPAPNQPFTLVQPGASTGATSLAPNDASTDNHDLQVTPSGTYVVLSYPVTTGVDLTGLTTAEGDKLGTNATILDCALVEFDTTGTVVSTWRASDHFDPKNDTTYLDSTSEFPGVDGGVYYDVFHCNSIDVDPSNGNYLISARQMDSVFYVAKGTGNVLWKMGGKPASRDNAVYVSVPSPFYRQHDARLQAGWLPGCNGGTGRVSVFDDETSVPPTTDGGANPVARGVIYDVIVGAGDGGSGSEECGDGGAPDSGIAGVATLALEYKAQANSLLGGSVRFSADGSRVVGWGVNTIDTFFPILTEYDVAGHPLLDLDFVSLGSSYRAIKMPLAAFDLTALRNSAGVDLP
jgi:hypothetical protein